MILSQHDMVLHWNPMVSVVLHGIKAMNGPEIFGRSDYNRVSLCVAKAGQYNTIKEVVVFHPGTEYCFFPYSQNISDHSNTPK